MHLPVDEVLAGPTEGSVEWWEKAVQAGEREAPGAAVVAGVVEAVARTGACSLSSTQSARNRCPILYLVSSA